MARGLTFTVRLTAFIAITCCATAMVNHNCTASSCGNIHNISFPFRLKTDPENCGYDYPYNTYLQKGTKVNYWHLELARSLVWMSCEKPVNSPLYLDTST
uniref:Wall-associated receptor kinase galacturonan-binding domain-containing protein n=1 Tax=Quercus lobata TaxID=97700 RepID=A0A7N2MH14_QUELO